MRRQRLPWLRRAALMTAAAMIGGLGVTAVAAPAAAAPPAASPFGVSVPSMAQEDGTAALAWSCTNSWDGKSLVNSWVVSESDVVFGTSTSNGPQTDYVVTLSAIVEPRSVVIQCVYGTTMFPSDEHTIQPFSEGGGSGGGGGDGEGGGGGEGGEGGGDGGGGDGPVASLESVAGIPDVSKPYGTPWGGPVTVTLGAAPELPLPSGGVRLLVDGVAVGAPYTLVEGSAEIPVSSGLLVEYFTAGTHSVGISYGGDENYAPSDFPVKDVLITRVTPMVSVDGPDPDGEHRAGEPLSFEITVLAPGFLDGFVVLQGEGGKQLARWWIENSTTTRTAVLPAGSHAPKVFYYPEAPSLLETSGDVDPFTVLRTSTTLDLDVPAAWDAGTSTEAVVTLTGSGDLLPTGAVALWDGATLLDSATIGSDGTARFALTSLRPGLYELTATFAGDANFVAADSALEIVVVSAGPGSVSVSAAGGFAGDDVGVSIVTGGALAGASGTVVVYDDERDRVLGSGTIVGGSGTVSLYGLPTGVYSVTIVFTPDAPGLEEVTTPVLTLPVGPPLPVSFAHGQPVVFDLRVAAPGTTGSATVAKGATSLPSATVGDGLAHVSVPPLAPGTHQLTVTYGDAAYVVTVVVDPLPAEVGDTPTNGSSVGLDVAETGPNGQVTITAAGFLPGETVVFVLHSKPVVLGSAVANGAGVAVLVATVPPGVALGTHSVHAVGGTSGRWAVAPLEVTSTGGRDGSGASKALASTGSDLAVPLGLAVLLLAAGGVLLVRRRNQERTI